jgi:hypothetical protein
MGPQNGNHGCTVSYLGIIVGTECTPPEEELEDDEGDDGVP